MEEPQRPTEERDSLGRLSRTGYTRGDTRPWKALFIKTYADTGNVRISCEAAAIDRMTYRRHYKNDPDFAAAVDQAREDAIDLLYGALFERGMSNDTTAAIFLLKNLAPDRFNERRLLTHEISGQVQVDHTMNSGELTDMLRVLVQTGQIDVQSLMQAAETRQLPPGVVIDGESEEITE